MSDDGAGTERAGGESYVHEPEQGEDYHGTKPRGEDREFGLRGWILVGWLVVALIVVPAYLFFFPRAGETLQLFGLGYRDTYLFVPLLPALVLGALAVWATTRP